MYLWGQQTPWALGVWISVFKKRFTKYGFGYSFKTTLLHLQLFVYKCQKNICSWNRRQSNIVPSPQRFLKALFVMALAYTLYFSVTYFFLAFFFWWNHSEHHRCKTFSRAWFRSRDLWVMGPARFHCATLLNMTNLPATCFTMWLVKFQNIHLQWSVNFKHGERGMGTHHKHNDKCILNDLLRSLEQDNVLTATCWKQP